MKSVLKSHVSKISRLLLKTFDVHARIVFFFRKKLVICRGLKFSLPQKVSPAEIKANFERAYCKVKPLLDDPVDKEFASPLHSIAMNYIQRLLYLKLS